MVPQGTSGTSTKTVTQALSVQPFVSVTVTQYCVVWAGEATGLAQVTQLSPVAGDHKYVVPLAEDSDELPPGKMLSGRADALAVIPEAEVTLMIAIAVHPLASVTTTL